MTSTAISFFTFKGRDRILGNGGTSSWVIDRRKAERQEFAVCVRNRYDRQPPEGDEPHRSAFMVGRIKDVVPAPEYRGRWLIRFSEYADVAGPIMPVERNPVIYGDLEKWGIDPSKLEFKPMPPEDPFSFAVESDEPSDPEEADSGNSGVKLPGAAIAEAKAKLALELGVDPASIEITVRW